jgi:hypothetical protein
MPGKRVQLDDETWMALDLLARDRMMDFQEFADEAFRDLLKKHNRPTNLKAALRQSAGVSAEVHEVPSKRKREKPPKAIISIFSTLPLPLENLLRVTPVGQRETLCRTRADHSFDAPVGWTINARDAAPLP